MIPEVDCMGKWLSYLTLNLWEQTLKVKVHFTWCPFEHVLVEAVTVGIEVLLVIRLIVVKELKAAGFMLVIIDWVNILSGTGVCKGA